MMLFTDWTTLWHTAVVGTLAYLALMGWLRVSGKRTLSRWNAFDAVVTFALGSMLATVVLSPSTSLAQGAVAFGVLVMLQLIITWLAVRFKSVRRLIKGRPTLLVYDGHLLTDVLKRERVTEGEVLAALREEGLAEISLAYAVVLETSGTFSVIRGPASNNATALADVEGITAA